MSKGDEDTEKQFDPTPKKLLDARKKGEIAKSADLTTAAGYGGLLVATLAFGATSLLTFAGSMATFIDQADTLSILAFSGNPTPIMGDSLWAAWRSVFPWLVLPGIAALTATIAQQAVIFAPSKIAPKLSKISPISGAKNKFGREGLFEFAKSATKLFIYAIITGVFLSTQRDRLIATTMLEPVMIISELGALLVQLLLLVLCVACVIGGIDYLWQSAEHIRKNKMSRKEITDEMKQSEGDPQLKQQRRQKGISIAMNRMLADVPDADVVIVNPTHYSIALKWDKLAAAAPICVAKGTDEIAARIREIAMTNGIPIHSDPPTARALHAQVEIGDEITPQHYRAVAAAIRFAESIRKNVSRT
jgi:flagellar biosynthetic protein FlhB